MLPAAYQHIAYDVDRPTPVALPRYCNQQSRICEEVTVWCYDEVWHLATNEAA